MKSYNPIFIHICSISKKIAETDKIRCPVGILHICRPAWMIIPAPIAMKPWEFMWRSSSHQNSWDK